MAEEILPTTQINTQDTKKPTIKSEILSTINSAESSFGGVSIRGIVCILLTLAIITYPFCKIAIPTEISTLAVAAISYYFGKNQSK